MKPPVFEYSRPRDVNEALTTLQQRSVDVRVLAGGQSLMPMLNFRLANPGHLMDINGLRELDFIEERDGNLCIGALTRHRQLLCDKVVNRLAPLVSAAACYIGHPAIRNRGTIGGSVSHADPAAELPVVLTVLDASIILHSEKSRRTVAPIDYFVGPLVTSRESNELVTEIQVPLQDSRTGWGFHEVARRHGDFALVSAAAVITSDAAGRARRVRLALGGIADRPVRVRQSEEVLAGEMLDAKRIRAAADYVDKDLDANADQHASAGYRRHLARVLAYRALMDAASAAAPTQIRKDSMSWK